MISFPGWLFERESSNTIYIDLDETLIWNDQQGEIVARPHVHKFIDRLQKIAPCVILTHGLTEMQTRISQAVGLGLPVLGRDRYDLLKPSPHAVLIDDRPADDYRTQAKIDALGIDEKRLIPVQPFWGQEDDDDLLPLVKQVRSLLHVNEWVEKNPQPVPNKQPFKTYKKARDLAEERRKKFHDGMREAAGDFKVVTDIKSESSFKDKTVQRGKRPEKVYDVLRGAIIVDNKRQLEGVAKSLKKVFLIKKIDHKIHPDEFGYYGAIHVDVIIDDMICEIQVLPKKLWNIKLEGTPVWKAYHRTRIAKKPREEDVQFMKDEFRKANGD